MNTNAQEPPDIFIQSDLTQRDKIQILLSEYSTLRTETMNRTGYGFQLSTVFVVIVTWALKEVKPGASHYIYLGVGVLCLLFIWAVFINTRDLTRAVNRVKSLEHEINSRAGEHLLIWEHLCGVMTRTGLIKSFFSPVKNLPLSQLPSLDAKYLHEEASRRKNRGQMG